MVVKINMQQLEYHELKAIADSHEYNAAKLLIEKATEIRDRLRKENEDAPRHNPENLNDDFVFKAGAIHALNAIIDAPEQALKSITKQGKR